MELFLIYQLLYNDSYEDTIIWANTSEGKLSEESKDSNCVFSRTGTMQKPTSKQREKDMARMYQYMPSVAMLQR